MSADEEQIGEFSLPLGGVAPPLQCNRLLSGAFDAPAPDYCGKPGKWHIIWTADAQNGVACDKHAQEARETWVFMGLHPYSEVCSMPGAMWDSERDFCWVEEEGLGLSAAAEKEWVRSAIADLREDARRAGGRAMRRGELALVLTEKRKTV